MLGKRDPQRSFFTAPTQLGAETVEQMGFYSQLFQFGHQIFADEDFAGLYCEDNGRPSTPPSLLAVSRLLQHYEGISDREVVERARYDTRWKVALDLDILSVEAPFAKSTFQAFRARLTLHAADGLAFEKSVEAAREAGILPPKLRVALDSSPVRGRGAVKDTFNLLSDAVAAVVRAVAKKKDKKAEEVAQESGLERHIEAPSVKGSEEVEWSDKEAVSGFLGRLLEDCDRALSLATEADCAVEEAKLLEKVIAQDVVRDDGENPKIRQGVAPDRIPSISDPEMRHGRKSSGKTYDGHKGHLAVDIDSRIITAVEMTAPGEADGSQVKPLLEQTEKTTGSEVVGGVGDSAYSSRKALAQAQEVGVDLKTKMPAGRKDRYGPGDFQVSEDRRTAHCPAGFPSARQAPSQRGLVHYWSEEQCGTCPLKQRCTSAQRRTLRVAEDFHERRERERYARSPEGRQLLRQRVVVEHALGRLKNLGAGTARYFGRAKSKAQWQWAAAVANLCLVWGQAAAATA